MSARVVRRGDSPAEARGDLRFRGRTGAARGGRRWSAALGGGGGTRDGRHSRHRPVAERAIAELDIRVGAAARNRNSGDALSGGRVHCRRRVAARVSRQQTREVAARTRMRGARVLRRSNRRRSGRHAVSVERQDRFTIGHLRCQ